MILNGTSPTGKPWFRVLNQGSESTPAEVEIYDQIGKNPWDNSGTGASEFIDSVKPIFKDKRKLNVRINSPGGSVWDALPIYNFLHDRAADVTCIVDGLAASAASIIALAGKETHMAKASLMMIHDPSIDPGNSNAEVLKRYASELETHADVLAGIYADKTGMTKPECRTLMQAETWMTAEQAQAKKFCDTVTNSAATVTNTFDLSGFKRVPEALAKHASKPAAQGGAVTDTNNMKEKLIALLKRLGVTNIPADATEDALFALIPSPAAATPGTPTAVVSADSAALAGLQLAFKELQTQRENERKARITAAVNQCVAENRITAAAAASWINRILADDTLLTEVQNFEPKLPGVDPVTAATEIVNESPKAINAHLLTLWNKGPQGVNTARERGLARAHIIAKELKRLLPVWNTNTIATELKRSVILQQSIRNFAKRILQLKAFSTVLNGIVLEGTDKVEVPYYALETATSIDFDQSVGYATGDTATDKREVTINKRKYQSMSWTSQELDRQPYLNILKLLELKTEKLGVDVVTDVLSLITNANFGSAAFTGAASTFDSTAVTVIKLAVKLWPEVGRSLFVDSAYDANLLDDDALKSNLNFGSAAIREGEVRRIFGFDYFENPNIPSNSENLVGFASFISAILFAQAPIRPTEDVLKELTSYEVIVDPDSGASFEYRRWGFAQTDESSQVVEVNYGYAKGEATAIKRMVSA